MSEQVNSLLAEMLAEQKKQTAILERMEKQQALLIQVLADDQADADLDAAPMTYLDGSRVNV